MDDNRKFKQVVEEQKQDNFKYTFYQKVQKLKMINKLISVMLPQPGNQSGKKGEQ